MQYRCSYLSIATSLIGLFCILTCRCSPYQGCCWRDREAGEIYIQWLIQIQIHIQIRIQRLLGRSIYSGCCCCSSICQPGAAELRPGWSQLYNVLAILASTTTSNNPPVSAVAGGVAGPMPPIHRATPLIHTTFQG